MRLTRANGKLTLTLCGYGNPRSQAEKNLAPFYTCGAFGEIWPQSSDLWLLKLDVDRNVYTRREVELLELVHCSRSRLDDVDQTLVCADFELVHRLFVNVDGTIDRELLDLSRKRHGAGYAGAGALSCFDDVRCGLVDNAIIKAFKADTDTWCAHNFVFGWLIGCSLIIESC